ncbi:uncharacterized protein LOC111635305, partial [Centruroides sculpturatus]|uniref:uncharacterized protein LOC111635305 n=1 Tax=Centruroides sculpturatus TaxID=218467 RepID=UPI000C6DAC43
GGGAVHASGVETINHLIFLHSFGLLGSTVTCRSVVRTMSRKFLEEFLKIYESEPCLWNLKNKEYFDRNKKEAGYRRLIEKLKEKEPDADRESVIKKINNIRSAYRKELKKIKASIKSGTDEIYEPRLWYFKLLRFLDNQYMPRSSRSNIDSDDDADIEVS